MDLTPTPPLSTSITAAQTERVLDWIDNVGQSPSHLMPHSKEMSTPLNHKCNNTNPEPWACTMSALTTGQKRAARGSDGQFLPGYSASAAEAMSTVSVVDLNEGTFDYINTLASATPRITMQPSSGLKALPPVRVQRVTDRLQDGLDRGWIPIRLQFPL